MELFTGNWLILSHSSSTAGVESHWPMKSLHVRPHCVSLGCSLEKTIGFAGAKYGHRRGWEWDAGKEEMADDSTAARGVGWSEVTLSGKISSPKKRKKKNSSSWSKFTQLRVLCFIDKHYLSDWNSCPPPGFIAVEVVKWHGAKTHLKPVCNICKQCSVKGGGAHHEDS